MSVWKWEAEGKAKAVVVIVHSAYEHHRRYVWLVQKLRNEGFHVVTGDLPGHGIEGVEVHAEAFKDYRRFIKKMIRTGLEYDLPLFLFGHGMGATFLMRLLQMEHIECAGVICTSPWLHLEHNPPMRAKMLTKWSPNTTVDHEITVDQLSRDPEFLEKFEEDPLYVPVVSGSWYRELQTLMKSVMQPDLIIQDVPFLLHTGELDRITDREFARRWAFAQNLSELQYKLWKEARHDVFQEPNREDMFFYTQSFMNNVLHSLGYVID
ncbi:alpha/beta hydrolase [Sporosarcina sp. P13]|uniref:alpha/beta fold hydrolase n=1 Tax=Sporosarcina sp. P13 TaxID=2048263 RepID=UPI000C166556|nr:alpha/beta hydrolase [Sporosarcina sp. P13]PIC64281.1 alpha/beta hydrolase [Sporosarcina sp. P13]